MKEGKEETRRGKRNDGVGKQAGKQAGYCWLSASCSPRSDTSKRASMMDCSENALYPHL